MRRVHQPFTHVVRVGAHGLERRHVLLQEPEVAFAFGGVLPQEVVVVGDFVHFVWRRELLVGKKALVKRLVEIRLGPCQIEEEVNASGTGAVLREEVRMHWDPVTGGHHAVHVDEIVVPVRDPIGHLYLVVSPNDGVTQGNVRPHLAERMTRLLNVEVDQRTLRNREIGDCRRPEHGLSTVLTEENREVVQGGVRVVQKTILFHGRVCQYRLEGRDVPFSLPQVRPTLLTSGVLFHEVAVVRRGQGSRHGLLSGGWETKTIGLNETQALSGGLRASTRV